MTLNQFMGLLVAAILSGLVGGGVLAKLMLRGLRDELRETFATREDLNGLGSRTNGLESVTISARERADEAMSKVDRLELVVQQQWERLAVTVVKPLERITEKMEMLASSQTEIAKNQALLAQSHEHMQRLIEAQEARMSEAQQRRAGDEKPPNRRRRPLT